MLNLHHDPIAQMLYCQESLRKPVIQAIIDWIHFHEGSRGLDVGCGIGLHEEMLAQGVGPNGHVTGLDFSVPLLRIASELTNRASLADRVFFHQGSWDQLPHAAETFDWVLSIDSAGYASADPTAVTLELSRVTRPGGKVILGFWSSQSLLPGYPALEARLNATPAGIAPFTSDSQPGTHFLNALGWMREAGLVELRVETFARTVHAPLDDSQREALTLLFDMRWGTAKADLSPEDWQTYLRLCRPGSGDFILDSPAYTAFVTYSVFTGNVPVKKGKGSK